MNVRKKPANIIYGLEESPPVLVTIMAGLQQVGVVSINLVYPLLVFRSIGAPIELVASMLSLGMFVHGGTTFLQSSRVGRLGSGYMCPMTFSVTYLSPSLLAAKMGGLPLVFGMTIFSGILETALAPLLNRLRAIFPPEISGLVIFVIGLSGGIAGLRTLFASNAAPVLPAEWIVCGFTLGTMIALNVWGKGPARMFCTLIGLVAGYAAAIAVGLIGKDVFAAVGAQPWFGLPTFDHLSWSFDLTLAAPFAIGSIAAAMKAAGTITVCQKMNDADWVRPDMKTVTSGVLADGLSSIIAGVAGALGANISTPAVGLAAATGVTSRIVAYAAGVILILIGFFPKLPALLGLMPRPVIVAALLFAVCFIIVNGLQIMSSRLLDARRTLIISLSIVAGMAVEVFPSIAISAPPPLSYFVGSSLVLSTVIALMLNLLFRIGVKKTASLTIEPHAVDPQKIETFFQSQGATWAARPDIVKRASYGTIQLVDAVTADYWREGPIVVEASFDEFNLDVRILYTGDEMRFPDTRPSLAQIRDSAEGAQLLAGFMLRRNADRIRSESNAGRSRVVFHFDH
jgi:NCS2 family nucleobase:cation symporter-2